MCCFSQPVVSVTATNIFARADDNGRQFVVYSMSIEARSELAMILPLPVRRPAGDADVTFISLKDYPNFFDDLDRGFTPPPPQADNAGRSTGPMPASAAMLPVVTVGDFEASFVPAINDFSRLDARFRISDKIWQKLPGYAHFGFAVFKLKAGTMTIHPMSFSFPRSNPYRLFFPTVHIHDGKVHKEADFDHTIYCQSRPGEFLSVSDWEESYTHPRGFMDVGKTKGILLPEEHCYKRGLHGMLPNSDTYLPIGT